MRRQTGLGEQDRGTQLTDAAKAEVMPSVKSSGAAENVQGQLRTLRTNIARTMRGSQAESNATALYVRLA